MNEKTAQTSEPFEKVGQGSVRTLTITSEIGFDGKWVTLRAIHEFPFDDSEQVTSQETLGA